MNLERIDPDDEAAVAELLAFDNAITAADRPWDQPDVLQAYQAMLRLGWDGEPDTRYVRRDGDGIVAALSFQTPQRENRHVASIGISVRPDRRRGGLGSELFESALAMAREAHRRVMFAHTHDLPEFAAFAVAKGFTRASAEIMRRQVFATLDWDDVEARRAEAAERAEGYSLLRFDGPVPDDMLEAVAEMTAAINDAPTDDLDVEDEVYDADRVRALERALAEGGSRWYRLIARRDSDGALVGHTIVAVHPELHGHGYQLDTSVLGAHRGHRLGMLLKASMMQWMREVEPELHTVDTWNAESNAFMIAVNEALGYRVQARYISWQRTV